MALISNDTIVAPTVDSVTSNSMDSTTLEPGLYLISESRTINGQTASIWNVTCVGNCNASSPTCYMQIWVPASSTGLTEINQNIYVRTINSAGTGFGNFTTFVNKEYFTETAAVNKTSYPMEIYAQTTQPSAQAGKTIIWIDTN